MSYRIVSWFEDCAVAECISCRDNFTLQCDEVYYFCPMCGEATEPVKRNERWTLPTPPRNWELDANGKICKTFSPHLVLERQNLVTRSISDEDFAIVSHKPKKTAWHLHSHTALGSNIGEMSASHWMVKKFKEIADEYDHARLSLVDGTKWKVIKEK